MPRGGRAPILPKEGERYGILTATGQWEMRVQSNGERVCHWEFTCDYGCKLFLLATRVRKKNAGCPCGRRDLPEIKPYNNLTPTGKVEYRLTQRDDKLRNDTGKPKNSYRSTYWECSCSCGKTCWVAGHSVKRGSTKSCGCLRVASMVIVGKNRSIRLKPSELSSIKAVMGCYRHIAKKRGYCFELTLEEFRRLTSLPCAYCGVEPYQVSTKKHADGIITSYTYNGIDRKDNEVGYVTHNVVPCCGLCNRWKSDLSLEAFKDKITQVYKHSIAA
jgi:hypothetical protein